MSERSKNVLKSNAMRCGLGITAAGLVLAGCVASAEDSGYEEDSIRFQNLLEIDKHNEWDAAYFFGDDRSVDGLYVEKGSSGYVHFSEINVEEQTLSDSFASLYCSAEGDVSRMYTSNEPRYVQINGNPFGLFENIEHHLEKENACSDNTIKFAELPTHNQYSPR